MSDDPTRLLDDPSIPEALRADLSDAAADVGPAYNAEAGLERLLGTIGAPVPDGSDVGDGGSDIGGDVGGIESIPLGDGGAAAGSATASSATASSATATSALAKGATVGSAATQGAAATVGAKGVAAVAATKSSVALWVGGGTAVALVSGGVALSTPDEAPPPPAPAVATAVAPAPPPPPKVTSRAPARAVEAPAVEEPADEEAEPAANPKPPPAAASPVDKKALVKKEIEQLGRARAALASDPSRALALANRGHRDFRGGMLYQEREAVAILALAKLGRSAEASSRGKAFLRAYPKGPFSERIRSAVGGN